MSLIILEIVQIDEIIGFTEIDSWGEIGYTQSILSHTHKPLETRSQSRQYQHTTHKIWRETPDKAQPHSRIT